MNKDLAAKVLKQMIDDLIDAFVDSNGMVAIVSIREIKGVDCATVISNELTGKEGARNIVMAVAESVVADKKIEPEKVVLQ